MCKSAWSIDAMRHCVTASRQCFWPIGAVISALIFSPLAAFEIGNANFYALVLLPITALGWALTRYRSHDLGLRVGSGSLYAIALAYPAITILTAIALVLLMRSTQPAPIELGRAARETAVLFAFSLPVAFFTEEGFFRGWLWGACARSGLTPTHTLWFTSLAFSAWHFDVTMLPGSHFSASETAVYMMSILFIGLNFGLLRRSSGSVLVSSVAHAEWNALDYVFFGSGENAGALGIGSTLIYDAERGLAGVALNALAAVILWRIVTKSTTGPRRTAAE